MFWRGSAGGLGYNTLIVLGPILTGMAFDTVMALEQSGLNQASLGRLYRILALLVLSTAVFQGLRAVKRWDFRNMSNRIGNDLRADLLAVSSEWPMATFDREKIGDLMSRAVSDVNVVTDTIMSTVTEFYDTFILMVSYFVVCLFYDWRMTLIASLPVPLTAGLAQFMGRFVFRRSTVARAAASSVNNHLRNTLNAVRVLRLFGREPAERQRFAALCQDQLRANLNVTVLQSGLSPIYAGLSSLGVLLVIAMGGRRVLSGTWTVGSFVAYQTMFLAMTSRTLMAANVLNRLHAGRAAWARIVAKLTQAPPDEDGEHFAVPEWRKGSAAVAASTAAGAAAAARALTGGLQATIVPRTQGVSHAAGALATAPDAVYAATGTYDRAARPGVELAVENLSFTFPGDEREALHEVSFNVPPGSLVAVTGSVGSGKSALATVLTGLYPYRGSILLTRSTAPEAGGELSALLPAERQRTISYLGQDPFLFSASIRENIAFGDDLDGGGDAAGCRGSVAGGGGDAGREGRLEEVARISALSDDLELFPQAYDTLVGEWGVRVSGGQRQRIALARALYRGTPIIILDDPFSAVDVGTEERMMTRLRELAGTATIFLFSHRLASFPRADLVLMMAAGRVLEQGAHDELVARRGVYARVFEAQEWVRREQGGERVAG